jgi:hypothetical protein
LRLAKKLKLSVKASSVAEVFSVTPQSDLAWQQRFRNVNSD